MFDTFDYQWLFTFVARYDGLTLTPNIATETSNLLAQIADPYRSDLRSSLRDTIAWATEVYVPSASATEGRVFEILGLTDASILIALATQVAQTALLTTDLDLYRLAISKGLLAYNFAATRHSSDV